VIKEFCVAQGWAIGFAEVRRYINSGAITVNGRVATDADMLLKPGDIVKLGKRKEAIYNG